MEEKDFDDFSAGTFSAGVYMLDQESLKDKFWTDKDGNEESLDNVSLDGCYYFYNEGKRFRFIRESKKEMFVVDVNVCDVPLKDILSNRFKQGNLSMNPLLYKNLPSGGAEGVTDYLATCLKKAYICNGNRLTLRKNVKNHCIMVEHCAKYSVKAESISKVIITPLSNGSAATDNSEKSCREVTLEEFRNMNYEYSEIQYTIDSISKWYEFNDKKSLGLTPEFVSDWLNHDCPALYRYELNIRGKERDGQTDYPPVLSVIIGGKNCDIGRISREEAEILTARLSDYQMSNTIWDIVRGRELTTQRISEMNRKIKAFEKSLGRLWQKHEAQILHEVANLYYCSETMDPEQNIEKLELLNETTGHDSGWVTLHDNGKIGEYCEMLYKNDHRYMSGVHPIERILPELSRKIKSEIDKRFCKIANESGFNIRYESLSDESYWKKWSENNHRIRCLQ